MTIEPEQPSDTAALSVVDLPAGTALLGESGVVYVRRPDHDVARDGLGEWRATSGGILMNWQVAKDAVVRLVPEGATARRCNHCGHDPVLSRTFCEVCGVPMPHDQDERAGGGRD